MLWFIEFEFFATDFCDRRKLVSLLQMTFRLYFFTVAFLIARFSEKSTLREALLHYIHPRQSDPIVRRQLRSFVSSCAPKSHTDKATQSFQPEISPPQNPSFRWLVKISLSLSWI